MDLDVHIVVLSISTILQYLAFFISAYALRFPDFRAAWAAIALATLLMAVRRSISLSTLLEAPESYTADITAELVALSISVLVVVGLAASQPTIRGLMRRLEESEKMKAALEDSESKYKALMERTGTGYVILDMAGNVLECNEIYVGLIGRASADEVVGHNLVEWVEVSKGADYVSREMLKYDSGKILTHESVSFRHPDGSEVPVEIIGRGQPSEDGSQVMALVRDMSERNESRRKLLASEQRANLLFENSPIATAVYATDGGFVRANKAFFKLWNIRDKNDYPPDYTLLEDQQVIDFIGREKLQSILNGEHVELPLFSYRAAETNPSWSDKEIFLRPIFFPLYDGYGNLEGVVSVQVDVTEQETAARSIRNSEARYRALVDTANTGYVRLDHNFLVLETNEEYARLAGYGSADAMVGEHITSWISPSGMNDVEGVMAGLLKGLVLAPFVTDFTHIDGTVVPVEVNAAGVGEGDNGEIVSLVHDISDRLQSEERLRQVQKMDAIGKLTGGVAHDFNNLLAVIIGNTELALDVLADGEDVSNYLQSVQKAADRGAEVTRRLLAFARQTPLAPKIINIEEALDNVSELLVRLIGEDIDLQLVKALGVPNCEVDPNELQNVIVNLANNARDAMPTGGSLTIESNRVTVGEDSPAAVAGDIPAGEYVVVSVTDTGVGIAPEIMDKVTEPFFTTKGVGEGTGLGLSMAYGFAKQSNGHLSIYSEVGEGTTIKIYLPAHSDEPEISEVLDPAAVPQGTEKILLVEDDPALVVLVEQMLQSLGYNVEIAGDVETAIKKYNEHADFDLLLSDLILPGGRNGRQLVEQLQSLNPSLKVMYMSGYTENAVLHHGRLDPGVILLQKPFRKADLAKFVRQALDRN